MATPKVDDAKAGESVAEHKARVIAATQAYAEAQRLAARASSSRPPDGFPKPPNTPSNIPDFMAQSGVIAPNAEPPALASSSSSSQNGSQSGDGSNEPEWKKVYRDRGWKGPDDVVRSYLNLEKEFYARLNEQRRNTAPPAPMPAPQYTAPYPQMIPAQVPSPSVVVQQLARKHGISIEDAERLLPFVAEVSEAAAANAVRTVQSYYEPTIQNLNRKVQRSEEIMDIAQDPAMRVPRVQFEVDRILRENPSVFQIEPQPLRWALDRALRVIAQESLGAYETQAALNGVPSSPPVTAGTGSASKEGRGRKAVSPTPDDLAQSYFSLKTAEEKKEILRQLGVA